MTQRRNPGVVRDAIVEFMRAQRGEVSVAEIQAAVERRLGGSVSPSSVRSYLNINTPEKFLRTGRGRYRAVRQ